MKKRKYAMFDVIHDFRDERVALKRLKINDGNEQRKDLYFIKHEMVEMARQ